jgi:hypothetical protein
MTMGISSRLRAGLPLVAAFFLSACISSDSGGLGQAGAIVGGVVEGIFSDEEAPKAPAKVDRSLAAKYQFASIGVTIDDNPQFLFLLANRTDTEELYTLGYQVSVVLRRGRVIRTQGLARDVLGGRWEGEDLVRRAMNAPAPVSGVRWFESAERDVSTYQADCTAQDFGDETITVLGTPIVTRHVSEECTVVDMKWQFRNEFWIAPSTGQVWLSLQHIHPRVNPLLIETFRPAN